MIASRNPLKIHFHLFINSVNKNTPLSLLIREQLLKGKKNSTIYVIIFGEENCTSV